MAFSPETWVLLNSKIKHLVTDIQSITLSPDGKSIIFVTVSGHTFTVPIPSGCELTEDITSSVNCGAITVGQFFPKGTSNTTMWEKLLVKDVAPLVTITSDIDATKIYEKGTSISPILTVTAKKINASDNDITKVTLQANPSDVNYDYVDNSPNANTNTYTKNTMISKTTSYKASAVNTKNLVGSKTLTFTFVNPIYVGSVNEVFNETSITENDIKTSCNKLLKNITTANPSCTEPVTANMKKIIIAYDKTLGTLKEINDVANRMNTITAFTKFDINVTTVDGTVVPYECFIGKVRSNVTNMDFEFVWN